MMGDLLKNMRSSQIFSVCGLPEVKVRKLEGPTGQKGEAEAVSRSSCSASTCSIRRRWRWSTATGNDVPAWFLDTDYNGLCFHVSPGVLPAHGRVGRPEEGAQGRVRRHACGSTWPAPSSAPFEAGRARADRGEGDRRPGQRAAGGEEAEGGRQMIREGRHPPLQAVRRSRVRPARATSSWPVRTTPARRRFLQAIAAWASGVQSLEAAERLPAARRRVYRRPDRAAGVLGGAAARVRSAVDASAVHGHPIEIEIQSDRAMDESRWSSSRTARSRSTCGRSPMSSRRSSRARRLSTVFVPAMTGLSTDEPLYQRPKLDQLLGQAKPGDILRNLLVEASQSERRGARLQDSIQRLFGYELLPPDARGATSSPSTERTRVARRSTSPAPAAASSRC